MNLPHLLLLLSTSYTKYKISINTKEKQKEKQKKMKSKKQKKKLLVCCIAGKILEDSKVVSDYKIEEKNFVVVMVTKVCDWTDAEFKNKKIKFVKVIEDSKSISNKLCFRI